MNKKKTDDSKRKGKGEQKPKRKGANKGEQKAKRKGPRKVDQKKKKKKNTIESNSVRKLRQHLPLLKHISKCNDTECKHLVAGLSNDVIRLICQIAVNVMNKNLEIPEEKAVRKLAPYKKELIQITKPKTELKKKRAILEQKGGFISALLGLAVPLISSIVGRIIRGRK